MTALLKVLAEVCKLLLHLSGKQQRICSLHACDLSAHHPHCRSKGQPLDNPWQPLETIKAAMPRTQLFDGWTVDTLQQELPIWVISLKRAKERRQAMIKGLETAGTLVQWESMCGTWQRHAALLYHALYSIHAGSAAGVRPCGTQSDPAVLVPVVDAMAQ